MPKPAVIAAVALLFLATGCGLPGVREILPSSDEQRTAEPADQEPPVPGAEEPVGSPEPTAEPGADEPDPGESEVPREPGGTGEPETAEESEPEVEEETPGEATEYMAALAESAEPERMREGLLLAAEDSTAHTYLRHFVQVYSAWDTAGESFESATLTPVDGGFELCRPEPEAPQCSDYTRFTMEDGLITGFLVDGADPGKRLVSGLGVTASSEGVDVHLLTAYQSPTDDVLVVTAEFTTVDNADLDLFGAVYTAPDGREYRADEAVGEYDLDAGTATSAALFFSGAEVGGDLAVTGCLDECFATIDLEFPVK